MAKRVIVNRPLSGDNIATLRFIASHSVYEEHLQQYNQTTVWCLFYRGYIVRGSKREILPTQAGLDFLRGYTANTAKKRSTVGDLTERVRKIIAMRHTRNVYEKTA